MKYTFRDEATYAADMRRLCILEGHKPALPGLVNERSGATPERKLAAQRNRTQAVAMFVTGKNTRQIAEALGLSIKTVQWLVRGARREVAQ